jgi:crotonobetainyl-CoA:carnitine CoA-transferase CaiB-like acyl-CoA transferase
VRFNGKHPLVKPAPLLGQNTGEVLTEWLGMKREQVSSLLADKVLGEGHPAAAPVAEKV